MEYASTAPSVPFCTWIEAGPVWVNETAAARSETLYPLCDGHEQAGRFDRGEITHKRIGQMNRKERRAFESHRRKELV